MNGAGGVRDRKGVDQGDRLAEPLHKTGDSCHPKKGRGGGVGRVDKRKKDRGQDMHGRQHLVSMHRVEGILEV